MDAGNLLRNTRLGHGLSQQSLAIRAGVGASDIAEVEDGRASPDVGALGEFMALMGEDLVLRVERRITGIDLTLNQGNLALSPENRVLKGLAFADLVRHIRPGVFADLGRPLRLGPVFAALDNHQVAFVVIGGIAGLVHGSAYPTYDLDLAYSEDLENRMRLVSALGEIGIEIDRKTLGERRVHSFNTRFGCLDLLSQIPGVAAFEELWRQSGQERIVGVDVAVASIDHLIAMKRVANRVKDQLMVMEYVELADEIRRREADEPD